MNIVVTVKQIPDPAVPGELNPDHTLKREGKLILDESDSYGVEMALQLADKAGGDLVTVAGHVQRGLPALQRREVDRRNGIADVDEHPCHRDECRLLAL